jgi:hypothetical protein
MTDTSSNFYVGLSERAKLWILALGAGIAVLNLAAAWYFAHEMGQSLRLGASDMAPFKDWINGNGNEKLPAEARYDLSARAMHIVAYTKLIANKQGLVLACFGASFALAAIGFALFVVGADGAFKASVATPDKAKVVLTGTAPGLLCFALAGWLVSQGITQRSELNLPAIRYSLSESTPTESRIIPELCAHKDMQGKCYTSEAWRALMETQETKK